MILGLWGVAAPDPGSASRGAAEMLDRGTSTWRPQMSLRGTLARDFGRLSRESFRATLGTYSTRISYRESYLALSSFSLPSFSLLVGVGDAYVGVSFVPRVFGERTGFREAYAAVKNGVGTFSELYQFKEGYAAQPSPSGGSTFGSYSTRAKYTEAFTGRKNSRGSFSTRTAYFESYTGVAGVAPEPPPTGQLSDEPLDTRIGSPYVDDVHQRIGTPLKNEI